MPAQPEQFALQQIGLAGVQPVADHQHQGAPARQAARVTLAQFGDRIAQTRAAGKVVDRLAGGTKHVVGVGQLEGRREIGQARTEGENVATAGAARGRM